MSRCPGYRLIEHTADMGIEARGRSRAEVLVAMARGLKAMVYADSPAQGLVEKTVALEAGDAVELLVAWLNEIVYWCERDNLVPAVFQITAIDDHALRGAFSGEEFDPQRHVIERQVKAVTHHQACFDPTPDGWHARVYVDL